MSASAGIVYSGERFERLFPDFIEKYHIKDMYSGGFHRFASLEEHWAWWSRHVLHNRYEMPYREPYHILRELLEGREYFVLTSNVDHSFQLSGFDKARLFYMQGDYGLWQCSVPCHEQTYDNEERIREMVARQKDMRVPSELVPYCPRCGKPMSMNLHADDSFVQDEGWHEAAGRYMAFRRKHSTGRVLYLELGVGGNTPGIIKYPFWEMTLRNPEARFVSISLQKWSVPREIADRSLCMEADICEVLRAVKALRENRV